MVNIGNLSQGQRSNRQLWNQAAFRTAALIIDSALSACGSHGCPWILDRGWECGAGCRLTGTWPPEGPRPKDGQWGFVWLPAQTRAAIQPLGPLHCRTGSLLVALDTDLMCSAPWNRHAPCRCAEIFSTYQSLDLWRWVCRACWLQPGSLHHSDEFAVCVQRTWDTRYTYAVLI